MLGWLTSQTNRELIEPVGAIIAGRLAGLNCPPRAAGDVPVGKTKIHRTEGAVVEMGCISSDMIDAEVGWGGKGGGTGSASSAERGVTDERDLQGGSLRGFYGPVLAAVTRVVQG